MIQLSAVISVDEQPSVLVIEERDATSYFCDYWTAKFDPQSRLFLKITSVIVLFAFPSLNEN